MRRSSASSPRTPPRCCESLRQGRRVTLDHVGIFADGVAVRRVGEETFALARVRRRDRARRPPTRSAPASRTSSRTRARCPSRRARWRRGPEEIRGARGLEGQAPGRDQLRREPELRPPAPHRRARRDRRAARGAARGGDPGAARQLPRVLRALGARSVTEFNYRYSRGARRRSSSAEPHPRRTERAELCRRCCAPPATASST
jgi:threonine dehydratase